jgi:peptidoglycan/xylan/chitin deacetylase (PgdA/CDA1 family)
VNGPARRILGAVSVAAGATSLVEVAPGATWLAPVRRRFAPGLAGLGTPGHVALTFDDGPHPAGTPAVLAALAELGWRATFFMLGSQVRAHPSLAAAVADAGHEVALHGDEHRYLFTRRHREIRDDLRRGVGAVREATGVGPCWFRPPYGVLTTGGLAATRRLGLRPLLWTAWGRDWLPGATPRSVVRELCRGVLDGGTVLLHDSDVTSAPGSWRVTAAALPVLAEELAGRGLRVGPAGEHGVPRRATFGPYRR